MQAEERPSKIRRLDSSPHRSYGANLSPQLSPALSTSVATSVVPLEIGAVTRHDSEWQNGETDIEQDSAIEVGKLNESKNIALKYGAPNALDEARTHRQYDVPKEISPTCSGDQAESSSHYVPSGASNQEVVPPLLAIEPLTSSDGKPLSKNQLKKLRRKEEWEAGREDRKQWKKEKGKAKKARKKAEYQELCAAGTLPEKKPPLQATQLPITLILDCGFDDLMEEKDRISLGSQITRCYSDNSKAPFRAYIALTSFNGLLRKRFDGILDQQYKNWKGFRTFDADFVEVAEQAKSWMSSEAGALAGAFAGSGATDEEGEVVYLSAESENTLTELKPYSTYIIGGLVDRNKHKGICFKRALDRGIKTAKLPIGKYLQMNSRAVLATNHVHEIMIKWLELKDWGEAFLQVMPKRKGGTLKLASSHGGDDGGEGYECNVGNDRGDDSEGHGGPQENSIGTSEKIPGADIARSSHR